MMTDLMGIDVGGGLRSSALIERFVTSGLAQVAFGVADLNQRVAAVIDPRRDVDDYLAWAKERELAMIAIFETHVHADFVSGARELAAATGATVYAARRGESQFPHQPLDDGEVVPVGNLRICAFWTPGHTPEHLSYLLFDKAAPNPEEPIALFSGDTLFAGDIGRPDLLGEAQTEALTRQLFETVSQRLATLPDDLRVYPGHGAGSACGKQIADAPWTTIGQERRLNYAFQPRSLEEFGRALMAGMPAAPAYYPAMKQVNRKGPRLLSKLDDGSPLSPAEVAEWQEKGAFVIDARDAASFAAEHIPGSVNVGLDGNFATWAGWLTPYERPVVLIVPAADRYEEALRELRRVGIDNVAGYLAGGVAAWREARFPTQKLDQLSVEALARRLDTSPAATTIVDVRAPNEWAAGHIPGARNVYAGTIVQDRHPQLPTSGELALICSSGYRSSLAASLLQAQGHEHVLTVPEGMDGWKKAGFPVITEATSSQRASEVSESGDGG